MILQRYFIYQPYLSINSKIKILNFPKGMQTQTAECLVIGEITCNQMIVVLNKIDLIPNEKRQLTIDKV